METQTVVPNSMEAWCCLTAASKRKVHQHSQELKIQHAEKWRRLKMIDIIDLIFDILVCAYGWRDINGKCFMMSTDSNDVPYQLNYEEAVEACYFKGGKLFEPANKNILQSISEVNKDYRI